MGMLKKIMAVAAAGALGLLLRGNSEAQQAFVPAVPTPAPIQTIAPTPLATPALFHCSCSTPGQPVVWAGSISAPSFFLARQAAGGRCLAALRAKPTSPFIPPPGGGFAPALPVPPAPLVNPCSACACN
jgi:hypothetical protein